MQKMRIQETGENSTDVRDVIHSVEMEFAHRRKIITNPLTHHLEECGDGEITQTRNQQKKRKPSCRKLPF
jgi:hypothetical protein